MINQFEQIADIINSLDGKVQGKFRTDHTTRILYSTDASIYKIEPMGVFYPANPDDISACVEAAAAFNLPILPRGSGSSLAGQAIGPGLIIDCSTHLDQILNINVEEKTALVEPGVILEKLNKTVGKHDLQFGPDPASAERATMGGSLANNAAGAHSIRYGMSADHLLEVETVLSDGSVAHFNSIKVSEAQKLSGQKTREGDIYRQALSIREQNQSELQERWPKTWRRASGYNLNYLLPWSPSKPPQWSQYNFDYPSGSLQYPPVSENAINLSHLIAGSEGTLGIIRKAKVRLVPKPRHTCLVLLTVPDMLTACESVNELLELSPSAVEIIPANMLRLAQTVPSFAHQASFIQSLLSDDQQIPNLLAVEFSGEDPDRISARAKNLLRNHPAQCFYEDDPELQEQIWDIRKVGLGLLMSKPGDMKPIPFIEDVSVPVEHLSEFVGELERILISHNTEGDFYAHASAGCLHIRPLINLKTVQGVSNLRQIAAEAINLIIHLGGSPSGEHGDGIARSEWLTQVFGQQIADAFRNLKTAADPAGILNPGKIVDPPNMDENLRYGPDYSARAWQPVLDFSRQKDLVSTVELCNGAGVCRKFDGVMCPSFQATKDEKHSTRGRANLLLAMFENSHYPEHKVSLQVIFEALDLCLACKGCKAECPSAVDMAKLKFEFLQNYYRLNGGKRHPIRDYLFAYIGEISQWGSLATPATNFLINNLNRLGLGERWLGISGHRMLPLLDQDILRERWEILNRKGNSSNNYEETVLFLSDPFTEFYQPEIGLAAMKILASAGCEIHKIPVIGSGRTLLSKGFVTAARQHASKVVDSINSLDAENNMPIIGIEPSEIYTLRDEYLDFFPSRADVMAIAERAMMIDEFLLRPGSDGRTRLLRIDNLTGAFANQQTKVFLHGHCYQKAQPPAVDGFPVGEKATAELLRGVGYDVELMKTGCCGMAGAFGYEAEHYDLSMGIGELSLFPQIRDADVEITISTAGFSCLTQIYDGTGKIPVHPVMLITDKYVA